MRRGRAQLNNAMVELEHLDVNTYPDDTFQAFAALETTQFRADRDVWYLDTGATHHMTFQRNWLTNYRPLRHKILVELGDDSILYATAPLKLFCQAAARPI